MEEVVTQEIIHNIDTSTLETLVAQNTDLLLHVYTAQLFIIGVGGAVLVLFLLYRFMKKFV